MKTWLARENKSFSSIQKSLFETEKKLYLSRFENTISKWSKRDSTCKNGNRRSNFIPSSLVLPDKDEQFNGYKTMENFLISPGKSKFAGMKPVFSNSRENHLSCTEHHLEFPYFIKALPKSGLKNNLNEYKSIITNFVKVDNKISKDVKKIYSDQSHNKTTGINTTFDQSQGHPYSLKGRIIVDRKKRKTIANKMKSVQNHVKPQKKSLSINSKGNNLMLEKVISKYIQVSLLKISKTTELK